MRFLSSDTRFQKWFTPRKIYNIIKFIIAARPFAHMTKMSDFEIESFLSYHEARNFVNLAENPQGSKG